MPHIIQVEVPTTLIVTEGRQGPPGASGTGGGSAGVFITDIVPTSTGIVGSKTYRTTVPANANLLAATSDTNNIRVHIACNGGTAAYSPIVIVNGVEAVLTESATKRWFTGYADVVIGAGDTVITATSDAGDTDTATVTRAAAGPSVLSIGFGLYPGTQSAVKAGDHLSFTATTDPEAVIIEIYGQAFGVTNGAAAGSLLMGADTGNVFVTAVASNALGTPGATFTANTAIQFDQTYPTISGLSVTYPVGQTAFGSGDSGTLNNTVANADTVAYSSADFTISTPGVYNTAKSLLLTAAGYKATGTNVTITATRAANGAVTAASTLAKYATVAPTAAISIATNPARLVSSPTGLSYTVVITPNQTLAGAPTMNASVGAWAGSWTLVSGTWQRSLVIADSDARGITSFTGLSMTGMSGIAGSSITAGANYIVGGMSSRTVTFPAYSRVAPLGAIVADQAKTSAQLVGGNVLARHTDAGVYANGYYIADANGAYNPTGAYLGLSDSAFAGSNTSGTLQATFAETA